MRQVEDYDSEEVELERTAEALDRGLRTPESQKGSDEEAKQEDDGMVTVTIAHPYDPYKTNDRWPDIVKYLKDLFPRAQRSGIFNVAVGLQQMIPGHMFTIGASDDGQVQSAPRTGVPGPDLSQYPAKDLRRVYHGTYPSRVIDM